MEIESSIEAFIFRRSSEITKCPNVCQAAVVGPAVELGGVFELLAAAAIDGQEGTAQVGERAHVAPEFLELGNRDRRLPVRVPIGA